MSKSTMNATDARDAILRQLRMDSVGAHGGPEEELRSGDKPTDVYLTGILYPQETEEGAQESTAESDDGQDGAADDDAGAGQAVSMAAMRKPASIGLSFSIEGKQPAIEVKGSAGLYRKVFKSADGSLSETEAPDSAAVWKRRNVELNLSAALTVGKPVEHAGPEGLRWWVRAIQEGTTWQVTVVLENTLKPSPSTRTESTFFQVGYEVTAGPGSCLVPRRPSRGHGQDEDSRAAALIYRDVKEWAVGHTCSAGWAAEGPVAKVWTEWVPTQHVPSMSSAGHEVFAREARRVFGSPDAPFRADSLAKAGSADELAKCLTVIPDAYENWLADEATRAARLSADGKMSAADHRQAKVHLDRARAIVARMRAGITTLKELPEAYRAFKLAQEAMHLQGKWKARAARQQAKEAGRDLPPQKPGADDLIWRPFQLGFQLLSIGSIAKPIDEKGKPTEDRRTMDLLWFPTGGGKTEAYLALIAFTAILRRLRASPPDNGAGVAILMRYTLRLLTIQQFERAARLILACEFIRRREPARLGKVPFSIGLWVGDSTTPNTVKDARSTGGNRAQQLGRCPACAAPDLKWDAEPKMSMYAVRCSNASCDLKEENLPVWTVDEDVYRERPTLLLGTIDKFAQVVFKPETTQFFGVGEQPPPELVIQDELHLISGPLGTMAAIYEAAFDRLCEFNGAPAKVIGSTATIRRAEPQVRALFDRAVCQFPPPILDATDSCFGVVDTRVPGRIYVGLTTAGRSPKFSLQAACGSFLQSASEVSDKVIRDPFWTLVTYFNSLRELGGALVMMYDDVPDSVELFARLHKTSPRVLDNEFLELTSRINSEDIPRRLAELEVPSSDPACCDVALATNMLSVGVDIPRLGLMVVNGQPKSMSEYIQATSRVGRNAVPGLILSVYNAGRPRDRSHFESFRTWHQMLYREVEATSVTPFAPRARDKALHAAIVAMVRHRVPGLLARPALSGAARAKAEAEVQFLGARAASIPAEAREEAQLRTEALSWLDEWERRGSIPDYKNDFKPDNGLLMSAEAAAQRAALGIPKPVAKSTPNSMREVEPTVIVRLLS